ncbi:MAG: VOC family protein [Acidimicrobiia bacterium]
MGERTEYAPGTFCWADLGTTDAAGAKAFYGSLFGWEPVDMPAGEGMTYTMLQLGEHTVCALYGKPADQGPPAWLSYVSVEDAAATAERARSGGGTVLQEPLDVFDSGRLALIRDPSGALFGVWQPARHIGATLVNDPGAMCMNQLNTSDPASAQRFYEGLFGWDFTSVGDSTQPFWSIANRSSLNGGMMPLPSGSPDPSHWLVYFTTPDLDGDVARIGDLGGQILVPPMSVPAGRLAVALDPQGATFALFEGPVDP